MSAIERQVHIDASPIRVAAALAHSPWRGALRIEPVGAGSRIVIEASIEPEALAQAVEVIALDEICGLRTRLAGDATATGDEERTRTTNPSTRRNTMTTITRHVTIDAPTEQVWSAIADFGAVAVWNPNVKASHLTSSETAGEGISRECQLLPVGTVQERVTEWIEGELMSIEIYEFKNVPAMRSANALLSLEPRGDRTMVQVQMTYEVGLGPVGAGMNSVMMKRQFTKAVTGLLAGLKHHVETGDHVDRGSKLPTAAVVAA